MWWSQKIIQEYVKRAQCFIREYDQYMLTKNVYVSIYRLQYFVARRNNTATGDRGERKGLTNVDKML